MTIVLMIRLYRKWETIALDDRAAHQLNLLVKQRLHIGTQDLKIAAIALVNDALLLSANLSDFKRVPGLRGENWLLPPRASRTD